MSPHRRSGSFRARFSLSSVLGKVHKGKFTELYSSTGGPPTPDDDPESRAAFAEDLSHFTQGLPRDQLLNIQSQLTTYSVSGLILAPLAKRPLAILDAGCGSCQWASEVAQSYPEAIINVVDTVDADIPISSLVGNDPLNRVKFFCQDLTEELPFEWTDKFDVINVRHLFYELPESSWAFVIRNLVKVLKPGGWIQIVDYGAYLPETHALGRLSRLNRHIMHLDGLAPEKISSIINYLQKTDLQFIQSYVEECLIGENNPILKFKKSSLDVMLPDLMRAQRKGILAGKTVKVEGTEESFPKTEKGEHVLWRQINQGRFRAVDFKLSEYNELLLLSLQQLQSGKRQVHVTFAQKLLLISEGGDGHM